MGKTRIGTWLFAGLALFVTLKCTYDSNEGQKTSAQRQAAKAASAAATRAAMTPQQRLDADKAASAAEAAKAKKEADFQRAVAFARTVKASAKNPASFELDRLGQTQLGALCLEYRARNSFNALVPGHATLPPNSNQPNASDEAWNKHCAGKKGATDLSSASHAM